MQKSSHLHIPSSSHLINRIALITGASRGIGQAVAKRFAAEGAQVILAARDVKGLEETDDAIREIISPPVGGRLGGGLACTGGASMPPPQPSPYGGGGSAILAPLDLTDPAKIEQLAAGVAERFGRLDILVGNAGALGELTPLPHLPGEIWDKVMAVNLTANFHLIRCFDALLKKSEAPRAMFVTSGVTKRAMAYWGAYSTSKAALEMMVKIYAAENAKTALKANLISPGEVRTRMHAEAMPGADPMQFPAPDEVTDIFVKLASASLKESGEIFYAQ